MPTSAGPTTPGFWRCLKCGTPNPGTLYITACIACGYPRPPAGLEDGGRPTTEQKGTEPARRARRPRLLVAVAAYGLVLMSLFLVQWGIGGLPAFLLTLFPRAVFLVPLVLFGLWAWRAKRPAIGGLIAAEALFVAGPLMGFVIPWARLTAKAEGPTIRIMSYNRAGDQGIETTGFLRYLERQKVDVVCFQELGNDALLDRVLGERGWNFNSAKTIATRLPIVEDYPRSPERNDPIRHYTAVIHRVRVKGPDSREFIIACVHMPTPRLRHQSAARVRPDLDRSLRPLVGRGARPDVRVCRRGGRHARPRGRRLQRRA